VRRHADGRLPGDVFDGAGFVRGVHAASAEGRVARLND